jgi:SAM-dependent methyltransferase
MTDLAAIRQHWDERAALGERAGSDDLIAKQLEQRALVEEMAGCYQFIAQPLFLEIGCGRGETARLVSTTYPSAIVTAIDASPAMIEAARQGPSDSVQFMVGEAQNPPVVGRFDLAYTQRCLINLPTWELQQQAIDAIADRLVSGGRFLMCENSQDGLDAINERRVSLGLEPIQSPWHNRYLRQHELSTVTSLRLRECIPFSAAYYYNSRILNAYDAKVRGVEPDYEAPINRAALMLQADDVHPRFAQGRLWIWEKP